MDELKKTDKSHIAITHYQYSGQHIQELKVMSLHDELPNFRMASSYHTQDHTGKFNKLIDESYKVLPIRHQTYDIQRILRQGILDCNPNLNGHHQKSTEKIR